MFVLQIWQTCQSSHKIILKEIMKTFGQISLREKVFYPLWMETSPDYLKIFTLKHILMTYYNEAVWFNFEVNRTVPT